MWVCVCARGRAHESVVVHGGEKRVSDPPEPLNVGSKGKVTMPSSASVEFDRHTSRLLGFCLSVVFNFLHYSYLISASDI